MVKTQHAQTNLAKSVLFEPYKLIEDFQGDSLGQFASYPPAQDIGYEPSLAPTSRFEAPGGRSLMRVIKPNVSGALRFGFIRKIRMVVSNDATISFAYRVNTPAAAEIEIALAGVNGILYGKKVTAQTNRWTDSRAKFSELLDSRGMPPPSGVRVEAFYVVANLINANPDVTYRFMIDDLSLQAARESGFVVRIPATEVIEPWPDLLSERGFRAGDKVAIETTARIPLSSVSCTLRNPSKGIAITQKLYDDGTHGDLHRGDGVWSNHQIYSLSAEDPTGLWKIQLEGVTTTGENLKTVVRLIVHPASHTIAHRHPNLFFGPKDLPNLIKRSQDPKLASLWSHLLATAKNTRATGELAHGGKVFELLDSEYLLPSLLAYFDILNRARSRIAHNAFEAYITNNAESRSAAKSAMLDVAKWGRWQPPWFNAHGQHTYYPAGLLAADVALGYDLLYEHLTDSERTQIRNALFEKSIIPTYKEYVLDNRVMTNTSNWLAHTVGGALIAAASIAHDVQALKSTSPAKQEFEIYVHGLLLKLEDHIAASFLADGSYGEGISYHEFDMETLGPTLNAVRRTFGIDYWKQSHVLDSLKYPLYTLAYPISSSLDMGDTHPPGGHGIAALVYESRDPIVRWYYSQFDRPTLSKFIFFDDSVVPEPPNLPTSRVFREKGNAVFRSGWDKEAIVFLFRAGPNFNHHHADQGSFMLSGFGESLITEGNWSDYYKDPYYATFFTQAVGHNTILVDGNPESQTISDTLQFKALDRYPRITDSITSEFYDGIGSELSSVYKDRLTRYSRRIVFIKPHYFVVFDDLRAKGKPAQFDFLLHLPDRERVTIDGATAIYQGAGSWLGVRSFAPKEAKLGVENGRIPYHIFSARTPAETPSQPAYLSFKLAKPVDEAQFLSAIVPAKNESVMKQTVDEMTEIEGENLIGIRVSRSNEIDLVLFSRGNGTKPMRHGVWSATAASVAITESTNVLKMFAIHQARLLERGGTVLYSSDSPTSAALNFSANEVQMTCHAPDFTRITFVVGGKPIRVLLNGKDLRSNDFSFNSATGRLSLNIPSGQHELKIMLR